jgi:hypothetical protein
MRTTLIQAPEFSTARRRHPSDTYEVATQEAAVDCVQLSKGAVRSYPLSPHATVHVRVTSGAFWITMEGSPDDYVLSAGEVMTFHGPGLLVAEGLLEINELGHTDLQSALLRSSNKRYAAAAITPPSV